MRILSQILTLLILTHAAVHAGWSEPVRISQPGDCWDPQIIASGDTLHVVYENTGERYDKISYVRSTDGGQSWSTPIRVTERGGATYFPRIVQNDSKLMVLWKEVFYTGYDVFNIGYALSSNNGATWDSAQYIFSPNWQHILNFAAAGYDSLVVVALSSQVAYDLIYYSLHSTNFGSSWSDAQEMFACYQSLAVDCDASGGLVGVSWDGRFDANHSIEIYYTGSTDGGQTWSNNIALSDTDSIHSQMPAIDIINSDSLIVCWMDYKYASNGSGTGDIFLKQSHDSGNNWDPTIELVYNHKAFKSDLAVNGDTIDIVWDDRTYGLFHSIIRYLRSSDGGSSWSDPLWLDSTIYHSSEDPALAVSNGHVYVVWNGYRGMPDSSALYFSYSPYEPNSIGNSNDINKPDKIELAAYPNPFNSSTTITLSNQAEAELCIYDIGGRLQANLHITDGKAIWNPSALSSGIYFARVNNSGQSRILKLIYLK